MRWHLDLPGLQHQSTERNARNPGDKANDREDGKNEENDASGPVSARQHVNGRDKAKYDVQDASDPDEGLWEC